MIYAPDNKRFIGPPMLYAVEVLNLSMPLCWYRIVKQGNTKPYVQVLELV